MRRGALAAALALALLLGACSAQPGGDGGVGLAAPEELDVAPSPELAPAPAPAPEDFFITAARSPPSKKPGLAALAGAAGGADTNTTAVQPGIALAAPVGDGGVTGTNATKPVAAAAAAASSQQPTIEATASPSPAVDPAAAALGNTTQPEVAAADVGASPPASPPSPIEPSPSPVVPSPSPSPSPEPEPSPSPEPVPSPSPAPSPSPPPPPTVNPQAQALLGFKNGLTNGADVLGAWGSLTDNPCAPLWAGVTCSDDNTDVTGLSLSQRNLEGPIASSPGLSDLKQLRQLDLSNNSLSGSIPDLNLPRLETYLLHGNQLSGGLPSMKELARLQNATLHDNQLTGSIPSSWANDLPDSAQVTVLPNSNLCGSVPNQPDLRMVIGGELYPVVNSLGSCFRSECNPTNTDVSPNLFTVAWNNTATVWDTAATNSAGASKVNLPCYQVNSPVDGYVGGDMAYKMNAWSSPGNNNAGKVTATNPSSATPDCTSQARSWTVDLRWGNLQLSQVVIEAGANGGVQGGTITVGDNADGSGGTQCASGITVQPANGAASAAAVVACSGQGRYLTISTSERMSLCRVSVYPEVANAATNALFFASSSSGEVQSGTYTGGQLQADAASGVAPTIVLELGPSAAVGAVSLGNPQNVASVQLSATNPLAGSSSRRLLQDPAAAGTPCQGSAGTYTCTGTGGYLVVNGNAGSQLSVDSLSTYLATQPSGLPPSPSPAPSPAPSPSPSPSPSPPPAPAYQAMWVSNLLLGGTVGEYENTTSNNEALLDAYNTAWSAALIAQGFDMDAAQTRFLPVVLNPATNLPPGPQPNVPNITASPFYYTGGNTGRQNLATNVSITVSSRINGYSQLFSILNATAVAANISSNPSITDTWGTGIEVWMTPYFPPPKPSSGSSGLSTGAIIGIACGGGAALLALLLGLFCCCRSGKRRAARRDSTLSKGSSMEEGLMEPGAGANGGAGGGRPAGALVAAHPPPKPASTNQLAEAQKLYQAGQGKAGPSTSLLPYGSAYGNGSAAAAAGAAGAAGAAALAASASASGSAPHHERNVSGISADDSQLVLVGGSEAQQSAMLSDDPLLEWILKTQAPPTAERQASAAAVAATVAATAAATAAGHTGDSSGDVTPTSQSGTPSAAAAGAGGTPRSARRGSTSRALDVRVWQFNFRELEIQRQCGEGSFGRVYLAKWRETLVAVKILMNTGVDIEDADDAERALTLSNPVLESLEKEASMMAALRHPNVVAFLGVCATPPCVATEYCARGSLTDVLRGGKNSAAKARQLDWARRLNMALDAAKGMHYLHEHSPPIIHRDLKSPNLLVDKHWRVKVSDFNLSKLMEENSVMSSMAATNPRWLAPEILAGQPASYESDVYAFGVVLWELLTWELPWGATNPWQVVTIVTEGGRLEIPPRDRLPGPDSSTWGELDAYVRLVQRCWAQLPQDRPRFKEVIADLRDMLERTLAGKGNLGGSGGPSRGATASPTVASAAGTLSQSAFGSGVPLPPTPSSPGPLGSSGGAAAPGSVQARGRLSSGLSGVSRTVSETGTGGSGYSSMAAEVGSLDDGMPRTLLGSSVQRSQ